MAKVVIGTDRAGRPRTMQPGNREWVTAIEAVGARGVAASQLIIFEAVMHQVAWYTDGILPLDWAIGVRKAWMRPRQARPATTCGILWNN